MKKKLIISILFVLAIIIFSTFMFNRKTTNSRKNDIKHTTSKISKSSSSSTTKSSEKIYIRYNEEVSDENHKKAREYVSSLPIELDTQIVEEQAKNLRYGYNKVTDGSVPPSIAKDYYFKGTSENLFFYLTYLPYAVLDETFLECYGKDGTEKQIFRILWKENYYYFVGHVTNGQFVIEEKFGDFPDYNSD